MDTPQDDLAARRSFRQHLARIAQQYPELTTPAAQARLAAHLTTDTGEDPTRAPARPSRPVGRPKGEAYTTISLKIPHALLARVRDYAGAHHQPVSALIRDGLEWRIGAGQPRVREAQDTPLPPAPAGHYYGAPCRARGHLSHGYSPHGEPQNLRTPAGGCVACRDEQQVARQQARVTPQDGTHAAQS